MLRDRIPSLTAIAVAFARGAGASAPDAAARVLVPRPLDTLLRASASDERVHRALRVASLGLLDHVTLRTLAIDDVVRKAVIDDAVGQLVVLGAGLDARAYRMRELGEAVVFEVDHPATQSYKQRKGARLTLTARKLVHVAVDFEREDFGERLQAAGHDAHARTLWLWEGVTPYLTPEAIAATAQLVSLRSASGSVLAMTYGTPEMTSWRGTPRGFVKNALYAIGEPLEGLMHPETAARLIESLGFTIASDTGAREWAERASRRAPRIVVTERLLVAHRS